MTQPGAPYTNTGLPELSDKLVVRSQEGYSGCVLGHFREVI